MTVRISLTPSLWEQLAADVPDNLREEFISEAISEKLRHDRDVRRQAGENGLALLAKAHANAAAYRAAHPRETDADVERLVTEECESARRQRSSDDVRNLMTDEAA